MTRRTQSTTGLTHPVHPDSKKHGLDEDSPEPAETEISDFRNKRIGEEKFICRTAGFSQCADRRGKVYERAGRMLAIGQFVRGDLPADGRMLTMRLSVQRGLCENIKPRAGIAVLREKRTDGCKAFRMDLHPARKGHRGI